MFGILILIIANGVCNPAPDDAAQKAKKELEGTWRAIALEEKSTQLTPDEVLKEDESIVISGNELTLRSGKAKRARFSFKLDATKSPKQIDLTCLDDDQELGVWHAIYSVEKEEMRICLGLMGPNKPEERPKEFATGASEDRPPKGKVMFTLKREKK